MFDFDLGIITEHRYLQNYEVFCNRCGDSIGVMALGTIREAIFLTYKRGGILCPDCRKNTCDGCGSVATEAPYKIVEGPKGLARLCLGCDCFNRRLNTRVASAMIGNGLGTLLDDEELVK